MKPAVFNLARRSNSCCIIGRRTSAWMPVRNTRPVSTSYLSSSEMGISVMCVSWYPIWECPTLFGSSGNIPFAHRNWVAICGLGPQQRCEQGARRAINTSCQTALYSRRPPVLYSPMQSLDSLRPKHPEIRADYTIDQHWERYDSAQHGMWRTLFDHQMKILPGRACAEFLDGLRKLNLVSDRIPDFETLSGD